METSSTPAHRRGLMLVVSSPSGAGKSTLCTQLLAQDRDISLSISVTTRRPRDGEKDGREYFFVTPNKFSEMVEQGDLLEHATVFQNSYGTPRDYVEQQLRLGRDVLFDIDWQGATQLRQRMSKDLVSIFILPPSTGELERRLKHRGQDQAEVVSYRMSKSAHEMLHWAEYDYVIINKDLSEAQKKITAILTAERLKRERQIDLYDFVKTLTDQAQYYAR